MKKQLFAAVLMAMLGTVAFASPIPSDQGCEAKPAPMPMKPMKPGKMPPKKKCIDVSSDQDQTIIAKGKGKGKKKA